MCITLFCTFLSNYNMKVPNFTFWRRHEHMTTTFLEVNSRTNHQHLMNWTRWNKGSKVWSAQILSLLMCRRSIRHHLNSIKEKECHLKIKKTFAIAYSGRLWFYLSCTVEIFQAQLNSFFTLTIQLEYMCETLCNIYNQSSPLTHVLIYYPLPVMPNVMFLHSCSLFNCLFLARFWIVPQGVVWGLHLSLYHSSPGVLRCLNLLCLPGGVQRHTLNHFGVQTLTKLFWKPSC